LSADELTVEATGETVGEAKWKALRELERRSPALDPGAVRFQVVSEGERGLLGVGYEPARVLASVPTGAILAEPPVAAVHDESQAAARLRALLEQVVFALGIRCTIEVEEDEETLTGTCNGGDLGLLIGKHGQTIDAVQTLAIAILAGGEGPRKEVVVDAEGYRERRRRTVEALAVRCAERALADAARVELDPMSAAERKLVHERLKDYDGVTTVSEGDEPNRYVVVTPA
jgi:spoIIIJ-associated protein